MGCTWILIVVFAHVLGQKHRVANVFTRWVPVSPRVSEFSPQRHAGNAFTVWDRRFTAEHDHGRLFGIRECWQARLLSAPGRVWCRLRSVVGLGFLRLRHTLSEVDQSTSASLETVITESSDAPDCGMLSLGPVKHDDAASAAVERGSDVHQIWSTDPEHSSEGHCDADPGSRVYERWQNITKHNVQETRRSMLVSRRGRVDEEELMLQRPVSSSKHACQQREQGGEHWQRGVTKGIARA